MAVKLSQSDFRSLVHIIQNLPDFSNVRDRYRFLIGAFEGLPRAQDIVSQMDLDGSSANAAVEVIKRLSLFGKVSFGKNALGVLLNYILIFKGENEEDTNYIKRILINYSLDIPTSLGTDIDNWYGPGKIDEEMLEKIIGENTLRHVNILDQAIDASKSVCRLLVTYKDGEKAYGTGFMISKDLVMTNYHVVNIDAEINKIECAFNYQLDKSYNECNTWIIRGSASGVFYANSDLDYTVFQIEKESGTGNGLSFKAIMARTGDRVSIIQHPGGYLKKISMQNNKVVFSNEQLIQYITSTEPGSSGSPVFNDGFKVIAIHHSGGDLLEPGTNNRFRRNEGISMVAILRDLQIHAPHIYAELNIS